MDGNWESADYWGGISDDVIQIKEINAKLTDEQRAKVEGVITAIKSGEFHPFTGPINDQGGTERVAEGATMTREELATMDWYVEGMTATIPK